MLQVAAAEASEAGDFDSAVYLHMAIQRDLDRQLAELEDEYD